MLTKLKVKSRLAALVSGFRTCRGEILKIEFHKKLLMNFIFYIEYSNFKAGIAHSEILEWIGNKITMNL